MRHTAFDVGRSIHSCLTCWYRRYGPPSVPRALAGHLRGMIVSLKHRSRSACMQHWTAEEHKRESRPSTPGLAPRSPVTVSIPVSTYVCHPAQAMKATDVRSNRAPAANHDPVTFSLSLHRLQGYAGGTCVTVKKQAPKCVSAGQARFSWWS